MEFHHYFIHEQQLSREKKSVPEVWEINISKIPKTIELRRRAKTPLRISASSFKTQKNLNFNVLEA